MSTLRGLDCIDEENLHLVFTLHMDTEQVSLLVSSIL